MLNLLNFREVGNDFLRIGAKTFCRLFELFCFFCCYFVAQNKIQDQTTFIYIDMGIIKEPVKLRQRLLKTGNTSLYLDIYVKGRRKCEHLNLYLIPERSREDKAKNRETLRLADAIRAKRVVEVQNDRYGFERSKQSELKFLDYFQSVMQRKLKEGAMRQDLHWRSTLVHLSEYCLPTMTMQDVTKEFIQGFREYLMNNARNRKTGAPLAQYSQMAYFSCFRACINQAYRDEIITSNPNVQVTRINAEEVERNYLTLEELRTMAATPFDENDTFRRAFLFSCLTGLRKSDVHRLRWGDVHQQGEFTRIIFRQKKTRGQEYIDINPQAAELMGTRRGDNDAVFANFRENGNDRRYLTKWLARAGITKKITFHCARHTFAVMMIDLGADIYTVSKLLGHRSIKTTQIYAKILDKKKQAAAMMIPQIF